MTDAPRKPSTAKQSLALIQHARGLLARAPLGEVLHTIAYIVRDAAVTRPATRDSLNHDADAITTVSERLLQGMNIYGTNLCEAMGVDALKILEGATRDNETPIDAMKRLVATARDHSDVGELLNAEGRNESPPRSLMGPVRKVVNELHGALEAMMSLTNEGQAARPANEEAALRTVKGAGQDGEAVKSIANRLVASYRLVQNRHETLAELHEVYDALRAIAEEDQSVSSTMRRLVRDGTEGNDLKCLLIPITKKGETPVGVLNRVIMESMRTQATVAERNQATEILSVLQGLLSPHSEGLESLRATLIRLIGQAATGAKLTQQIEDLAPTLMAERTILDVIPYLVAQANVSLLSQSITAADVDYIDRAVKASPPGSTVKIQLANNGPVITIAVGHSVTAG